MLVLQSWGNDQAIDKILNERDKKIAKATRFQKHIPPPLDTEKWGDNEEWINAVIAHAVVLGIDTTREHEYELLVLAAESLGHPLPPGWAIKRGGFKPKVSSHSSARSNASASSSSSAAASSSSSSGADSGAIPGMGKKETLVTYSNQDTGAVLYEHPLNGYFRAIVGHRKMAVELEGQGKYGSSQFRHCLDAEDAMRDVMEKVMTPKHDEIKRLAGGQESALFSTSGYLNTAAADTATSGSNRATQRVLFATTPSSCITTNGIVTISIIAIGIHQRDGRKQIRRRRRRFKQRGGRRRAGRGRGEN